MLTIRTPAKLNLTLEVLGKRPDGYHEIRSVMQTIGLYDTITFRRGKSVTFESDTPEWAPEKSLVTKAANLLRETTGSRKGATIGVSKLIPLISGLGGDSSDAAAVLRGLNELWGTGLSGSELQKLAAGISSDTAFFVQGGTALAEGRGEKVTPLPPFPRRWVVLVVPGVARLPGKTGQAYAGLQPGHFTDGRITERLAGELKEGKGPFALFNTFENLAFGRSSELKVYRDHIRKLGAEDIHLTGTGPALFTLFEDRDRAEDLYTRCKNQSMETYLVETVSGSSGMQN